MHKIGFLMLKTNSVFLTSILPTFGNMGVLKKVWPIIENQLKMDLIECCGYEHSDTYVCKVWRIIKVQNYLVDAVVATFRGYAHHKLFDKAPGISKQMQLSNVS